MKHSMHIELGNRRYPIFMGQSLLDDPDCFTPYIKGRQVVIVTNDTIAPLYLDRLLTTLSDYKPESIILPDGEQFKTLETVNTIYTALLEKRMNRTVTLVALGGGVVGDMTGFAAASYQRGVNFIQVPTTLLAQVDSSVGGKTGVNHPLGKNMIGAFYQPQCVVADTDTLNTLDDRQLAAGMAEVIKYGLIRDPEFARWLQANIPALMQRDSAALIYAIEQSCRNKAELVIADELEKGQRALLNLGHTFGHAIETATGYTRWLHGEAVAAGMYMAAVLSCSLGWISQTDVEFVKQQLLLTGLPVYPPETIDEAQFMQLMSVDKKVLDSKIRLILLKEIGKAVISDDFDPEKLSTMLREIERTPGDTP